MCYLLGARTLIVTSVNTLKNKATAKLFFVVKLEELVNLYQFLYHVTLVVIFQVKSWSDSTFCCFIHWELESTLLKNYPAVYLVII